MVVSECLKSIGSEPVETEDAVVGRIWAPPTPGDVAPGCGDERDVRGGTDMVGVNAPPERRAFCNADVRAAIDGSGKYTPPPPLALTGYWRYGDGDANCATPPPLADGGAPGSVGDDTAPAEANVTRNDGTPSITVGESINELPALGVREDITVPAERMAFAVACAAVSMADGYRPLFVMGGER